MNIKRRALLIDNGGGLHRISDWTILTTNLGTLLEPRQDRWAPAGASVANLDWSTDDHKITDLMFDSTHNHSRMLSGGTSGGTIIHGGTLTPQTGR